MTFANVTISAGSLYTLRGINLDLLPDDLILTYSQNQAQEANPVRFWVLDSRGDDFITFRVQVTDFFTVDHIWNFIYSPSAPPRVISKYILI